MGPKRQVTLAEDKSQISQVSDHFLQLTLWLYVETSLLEQRGSWKLVVFICNIGPRDYAIVVLSI